MRKLAASCVTAAIGLAMLAGPVTAATYCDPERVSNPGTVTVYGEAVALAGDSLDDARAKILDTNYFVEANSTSRNFVSLRRDSDNYVRFGTERHGNGVYRVFAIYVLNGETVMDSTWTSESTPLTSPIDGSGDDLHRFTINRVVSPLGGSYFDLRIDSQHFRNATSFFPTFTPTRARIGYELDNGGSQWFGKPVDSGMMNDIVVGTVDHGDIVFLNRINNSNKANFAVGLDADGDGLLLISDKDC